MKILVVIPCYNKHIPKLLELLESIEKQTRQPDMVSISCSSTNEFPELHYSFPVIVQTDTNKKKPSENRNNAVRYALESEYYDIISFFDADDIMHPQRLELLEETFSREPCDIVLHSYEINEFLEFPKIITPVIYYNMLSRSVSGCIQLDGISKIAHGHVTVRKEIWDIIPFPEEDGADFKEDCIFCYNILGLPNIKTAYLNYPLLKYIPSFSYSRD